MPYLKSLESEAIYILREAVATMKNPVLLYSIGKDSSVLLHLARKAFYPGPIPFPLMHIDTTWKFKEMIEFREHTRKEYDLDIIVYTNHEGIESNITPFTHGSYYTDVMKTQALRHALNKYAFDGAIGGARRDEEKSRAKERFFSFRNKQQGWDPKNQRPELWRVYNTNLHKGESLRIFPLSNWTELDIWLYIEQEKIPVVPLYFAKQRNVTFYNGQLILVDDDRTPLELQKNAIQEKVRFRTLGCYPLTGAIKSDALCVEDIIEEIKITRNSERQGRLIDKESSASMEKKKKEGYF